MEKKIAKNVLGTELKSCCNDPLTGYFRDGYCRTDETDSGTHVLCAIMTQEFLNYSASRGNDLITPRPQWNFPGLKPGDKWCLCVSRWLEAVDADKAPKILMSCSHERALEYTSLELLKKYEV